ncbi:MAG: periplasmic nitrate reductase, NapE protein [Gammaproteobacteria bacterium MedPE]|nr:MAG: periplasmic nitrate reductase, NapE protein [Gammaproteobacteria bacterium MedPE]
MSNESQTNIKRKELRVFLFLTVVLFPVLSIAFMGGYGFIIWMSQLIYGPPGL